MLFDYGSLKGIAWTCPGTLDRLFDVVKKEKGHLDILYASAGVGDFEIPIEAVTEAVYDKTFDINVKGTIFTVQKALPLLVDGGSIIMTGSIAGVKAFPGMSVYCATKAAIRSLARTWTMELKPRKIRVNVLSPGSIDTAVFDGVSQKIKDALIQSIPMGRFGTSGEIATAALFLASADSTYVTGIDLFVDGGAAQV